ncbi:hypothetical protein EV360DRAFT_88407 [Lentinula raphanica]|nr:hypothetical protein EV360DRAFT_88407 [Lentinula raphanica]
MTYQPKRSQHSGGRVSEMLHTLRGEHFRHSQNVSRSAASLNTLNAQSSSTARLLNLEYSTSEVSTPTTTLSTQRDPLTNFDSASGPPPPTSWRNLYLSGDQNSRSSSTWRAEALSLIFHERPSTQNFLLSGIPSLTQLCFTKLLSECTSPESIQNIATCLPEHLRWEFLRYASIHHPLSKSELLGLLGSDSCLNGELIVCGLSTSLYLGQLLRPTAQIQEREDWDSEDQSTYYPLKSLIVLSTRLSMSTISALPPTLTHLALINLEYPISLHRLPVLCPSLVVLDLSYNLWLAHMSVDTLKSIRRIEWGRWTQLRTLGWRECFIPDDMLIRVNEGRWDDVEVVLDRYVEYVQSM